MALRARPPTLVALALSLLVLSIWRGACVLAGPDIDTDAYAHHMIARAILADPRDLAVHWVWLPLFHYAQVPLVALGGTLNAVRWFNVVLAAALPLVLFAFVRRTARGSESGLAPEAVALLAALFAAACPIAMQMGTTAQPEPLFALLVLGAAIAFQQDRAGWTAALLGAAVMLRYEAWASLGVVAGFVVVRRGRGWPAVAVPVALILLWAALRRPVDGQWFAFLRQTKQFANDALHQKSGVLGDLLYYPVQTAYRVTGSTLPLAVFGVVRTVRQQGARFVLVLGACLGFVSLTWITRSSLGLDRHFVCVVPLYAVFSAQGVAVIADALALDPACDGRPRARGAARGGVARGAARAARRVVGVLARLDPARLARAQRPRGVPRRAARRPHHLLRRRDDRAAHARRPAPLRPALDRRSPHVGPGARGGARARPRLRRDLAAQAGGPRRRRRDRVHRRSGSGGPRSHRGGRPAGRALKLGEAGRGWARLAGPFARARHRN